MTDRDEAALSTHTEKWLAKSREQNLKAPGAYPQVWALDIIMLLYFPTYEPIDPDPERVTAALAARKPQAPEQLSAETFRKYRHLIAEWFAETPDGRWVPNPEIFHVSEGYASTYEGH